MEKHEHKGKVFSVNGKIYCKECQPDEKEINNICYCECHSREKDSCPRCKIFHK